MASVASLDVGQIAQALGLPAPRISAVVELLDGGNTVPFITRYRKDQTGGLDEEQIRQIQARVVKLRLLAERKQTILRSIESQGLLTAELAAAIHNADTTKRLEDLYLPYKPKKQTLATQARDRGLEPLAREILEADPLALQLDTRALDFVNPDKKVANIADALLGAGHILAELFSERADLRGKLRGIFEQSGVLVSVAVEPEAKPENKKEPKEESASVVAEPVIEENPVTETPDKGPVQGTLFDESSETPPADSITEPAPITESSAETVTANLADPPEVVDSAEVAEPAPVANSSEVTAASDEPPATLAAPAVHHATTASEPTLTGEPLASAETRPPSTQREKKKDKQGKDKKAKDKKEGPDHRAFRDYFNYREEIGKVPPHRLLAINRGERAKALRVKIEVDVPAMERALDEILVPAEHPHAEFLRGCALDALQRLVLPSLEREVRREMTDWAESHAVRVFARNLRNLLLQSPIRGRRILAIDPGYKSGCKLVALDEFGNVLGHGLMMVIGKDERRQAGRAKLVELIQTHQLTTIVIGNGTACRETERVVSDILAQELAEQGVTYAVVNEAGASVYSTSTLGRQEFPAFDATVRGCISIGRRLQDPLSELVKIDAANLGIGMYQHDVKAKHLRDSLDAVVESCVNFVGVDVNTASPALLRYVSGLNQLTAQRVYDHRQANGPFRNREQFKDVSGIGDGTFVQAAGFLKIGEAENPLDATWIHPESYPIAEQILSKLGFTPTDLHDKERVNSLAEKIAQVDVDALAAEIQVGAMTLRDILAQLARPGRDPRESLPTPIFKKGILKIDDLEPGMELDGTILNVVDFGAFIDIGLKDSGLVHISQLIDRYVQDPHEVVAVGDIVKVWVLEVDKQRRRVSLTMIKPGSRRPTEPRRPRGERPDRPPRPPRPATTEGQSAPPAEAGTSQGTNAGQDRRPPRREQRPAGGRPPQTSRPSRPQRADKPLLQAHSNKKDHTVASMLTAQTAKKKKKAGLTENMREGKEPLRTFGDLKQLWNLTHGKKPEDGSQ